MGNKENTDNGLGNNIDDEIAAHNAAIDAQDNPADQGEGEQNADADADNAEGNAEDEDNDADAVDGESAEDADEGAADEGNQSADTEFEFTADADDETFETEVQTALALYDVPPPIQTILDRRDAQIQVYRDRLEPIESVGRDDAVEIIQAFDGIYETRENEGGEIVMNVAPVADVVLKKYKREAPAILREMLMRPSAKYPKVTNFLEIFIDEFQATGEELRNVLNYLQNKVPLPAPPKTTPDGIGAKFAEAWAVYPEIKKLEVESLIKEIANLQAEVNGGSYYSQAELTEKIAKFDAEKFTIEKIQNSINDDKRKAQIEVRQKAQAKAEFFEHVAVGYKTEAVELLEKFAKTLAPQLTFIAGEAQLSMARNITTRVANALSFLFDENFEIQDDPFAAEYARQLTEEGIKFDFNAARELLKDHLRLTRRIMELERDKYSEKAIEKAQRDKKTLLVKIKEQQTEIVGQLGAKYIKASSAALKEKTDKILEKKQITRKIIDSKQGAKGKEVNKTPTLADVDKEIAAHNKKIQAAISRGDIEEVQAQFA